MSNGVKISDLLSSVCRISARNTEGQNFEGHGVLLFPDVMLTAWHVLSGGVDIGVSDIHGNATHIPKGKGLKKKDGNLDLAIVELSSSLKGRPVLYSENDTGLKDMKGFLVTMFTGSATHHRVGYDSARALSDLWDGGSQKRTFYSPHRTQPGYSGSPVFNQEGRLVSVVSNSASFDTAPPEGLYYFQGPSPALCANFIKQSLDI